MRNVLAITVALTIAAVVIMPALGYTNQAAGNQSYSVKSGDKIDYSFTTDVPAHNLTSDMVSYPYSFQSSGVKSTRMPGTFQQGAVQPYSVKVDSAENAIDLGGKAKKDAALLGSMNQQAKEEAKPAEEIETAPVEEAEAPASVAAPSAKFTIEGMAFNDSNANSTMDADEAGLAGLTVNLEGAATNSAMTGADGKFSFTGLDAGEYTVSLAAVEGWSTISPAEGKIAVTIADANITGLLFANQLMPVAPAPAAAENLTAEVDINATANATAANA